MFPHSYGGEIAVEEEQGEALPDQKVLLVLDVVYKDRLGADKNYTDLIQTFQDNFDCEILPGKKPGEGGNKHL